MKEKIQEFLATDLLERYLMDDVSELESARVERYIAMYPEVRKEYMELQENLEVYARLFSVKSPEGLRERIMHRVARERAGRRKFINYSIAASIAALFMAGASFFFWNQNQNLQEENALVNNKIQVLEADMKEQLEDVRNQFIVLNNPGTRKFMVNGNRKARDLKAIAYVNPVKKLSYINVRKLPNLPEDQDYQMWAEVNGEMVNLGVLGQVSDEDKLMALPYGDKGISYITIEPKGGNTTPSVQNIVADFSY